MCNEYEGSADITCQKCWKGTLMEAEMHIFLKPLGSDKDVDPYITRCFICTECQNITDIDED